MRRNHAGDKRNHVKQRERQNPDHGAVAQPHQLPPHNRVLGVPQLYRQHRAARQIHRARQETQPHADPPAIAFPAAEPRLRAIRNTKPRFSANSTAPGNIQQREGPFAPNPLLRLRKNAAEVQERGRRQEPRHQIPKINDLVEIIQLARNTGTWREQKLARHKKKKCKRSRRPDAPEVHEQTDGQDTPARPHIDRTVWNRARPRR